MISDLRLSDNCEKAAGVKRTTMTAMHKDFITSSPSNLRSVELTIEMHFPPGYLTMGALRY